MSKHPQIQLIFGQKYDGVVEAVHLTKSGKIDWVRAYERRGPTWSDHVLLDRETLLGRLEKKKRFYTGKRVQLEASEFEIGQKLEIQKTDKGQVIGLAGGAITGKDSLVGVPLI